jgi:hypothetical protein
MDPFLRQMKNGHNCSPHIATHFYPNIRIVSTMPTLTLVYLTEQQYAGMTDHAHAANNTTAEEQLPSIDQEQTATRLVPIADGTRNATSNKPPVGEEKKMEEQSDHHLFLIYSTCDSTAFCSTIFRRFRRTDHN